MEHFVAYHSVHTMGRELEKTAELEFLSRKESLLRKAVGNTVWVIQGTRTAKATSYTLMGAYTAEGVAPVDEEPGLHVIFGPSIKVFQPPLKLEIFSWFSELQKSQSNFSLGFNRINDETVVQGLLRLLSSGLVDFELGVEDEIQGFEGRKVFAEHQRVERQRGLVEAKKAQVLAADGRLACQACGFDFEEAYGLLGAGLCEVHHLVPLALFGERVTSLDDLCILCANCHRVIHRTRPMMSVEDLSRTIEAIWVGRGSDA